MAALILLALTTIVLTAIACTVYGPVRFLRFKQISQASTPTLSIAQMKTASSWLSSQGIKLPVLLVFSDAQCPFCREQEPPLEKLEAEGEVQVIRIQFPLPAHQYAKFAAQLMIASEKLGDAPAMYKLMYSSLDLKRPDILKQAAHLGLPESKLNELANSSQTMQKLKKEMSFGKELGITATQTFVLIRDKEHGLLVHSIADVRAEL